MYNNLSSSSTLAATGGGALIAGVHGLWWVLAAFAMIAVGTAMNRIIPKKQKSD